MMPRKTSNNINKDYKSPIKDILKASTVDYLLSPYRSKRILIKIVWIVFIFGFLVASLYYVSLHILDYLLYETNTSIYEIIEEESEFPTVSFCDMRDKNFNLKILKFTFKNEELKDDWQNHLESYTDTTYGNCFRFNSGKNMSNQSVPIKKSIRSGLENGFWLNYYFNTTTDYSLQTVYIHNITEKLETLYHKGYYFSSGSYNFFKIKRVFDHKLESPYNECFKIVSKSDYNQTMINQMTEYSQKECIHFCFNYKFKEINPCNKSYKQDIFSVSNECVKAFTQNSSIHHLCLNTYCPLQCNSLSYEIIKDTTSINGQGVISKNSTKSSTQFVGFNTYENMSKTFYSLRVYYQDLKYTLISQHPKIAIFDLISSVGGTLGLFLGFSFISLLDLFEILAELLYIRFE